MYIFNDRTVGQPLSMIPGTRFPATSPNPVRCPIRSHFVGTRSILGIFRLEFRTRLERVQGSGMGGGKITVSGGSRVRFGKIYFGTFTFPSILNTETFGYCKKIKKSVCLTSQLGSVLEFIMFFF